MSAEQVGAQLSAAEMVLLERVANRGVFFSRGCYRLNGRGTPAVGPEIQVLRSRMLVRLTQVGRGQRMPPTRMVELTETGKELWEQLKPEGQEWASTRS